MKTIQIVVLILLFIRCNVGDNEQGHLPSEVILGKHQIDQVEFKNDLIYIEIPSGLDTLTFFTDTGGGRFVFPEITTPTELNIDSTFDSNGWSESIVLGDFFEERNIPSPFGPMPIYRGEKFRSDFNAGLLGSFWFGKRKWEIDYENDKLSILDSVNWSLVKEENTIDLGFQKDSADQFTTYFPSIKIVVGYDTIPVLFDSGATITFSDEAIDSIGSEKTIAGSFIIASIFDKWRTEHPGWKYLKNGDQSVGEDVIEVPQVKIGNHTVGPVWFARRNDSNFTEWMSKWMDRTIEGAIGGSCFKHFESVIIDYPNEKALFLK